MSGNTNEEKQLINEAINSASKISKEANIKANIYKYTDMLCSMVTITGSTIIAASSCSTTVTTALSSTIAIINGITKGLSFYKRSINLKQISVQMDVLISDMKEYITVDGRSEEDILKKLKEFNSEISTLKMKLFLNGGTEKE